MRPLERVDILIEARPAQGTPRRDFYQYDRLSEELARELAVRVQVVEGWLRDVPRDGMLLIADHIAGHDDLIEDARTAANGTARPILIGPPRGKVDIAGPARLAGVVTADQQGRWKLRQEGRGPALLFYGLQSLAAHLPPTFERVEGVKETREHCFYDCREAGSLPAMLARYIRVYWEHGIVWR